ncbi:FecR family protein [uncultured Salegentibacter sp.]|uniref:FecR family protein n=1 Tax=uncultured Salegentibacter sp. TaxID=259320 RepID=UPI002594B26E|nr:FecR family protein [uncultured Salegentibacter sp.]
MEKIIIKYLNNEASSMEIEKLNKWLEDEKNRNTYKSFVKTQYLIDRNFAPQQNKAPQVIGGIKKQKSVKRNFSFLKYAAVFAAIILGGLFIYYSTNGVNNVRQSNQITLELEDGTLEVIDGDKEIFSSGKSRIVKDEKHKLVYKDNTISTANELQYNTLRVPFGKTFELRLTDGSEIILNAGTELKYPVAFLDEGNREVFLKGEAYFKVAHDSLRPFLVSTSQMEIEVLGTQFNVTAYENDQKTKALLVSGKVSAVPTLSEESVILRPNQLAEITGGKMKVSNVNPDKYLAWIDGNIIFINDSFEVIKNKLERKFNVVIDNRYVALNDIKISGSFETESIDQVLQTFQKYKAFNYKKIENKIIITKP